jgi:hypothetical protein
MRNLDSSERFEKAQLVETKSAEVNKKRVTEFSLNFAMKRALSEDPKAGGRDAAGQKPAAPKTADNGAKQG